MEKKKVTWTLLSFTNTGAWGPNVQKKKKMPMAKLADVFVISRPKNISLNEYK